MSHPLVILAQYISPHYLQSVSSISCFHFHFTASAVFFKHFPAGRSTWVCSQSSSFFAVNHGMDYRFCPPFSSPFIDFGAFYYPATRLLTRKRACLVTEPRVCLLIRNVSSCPSQCHRGKTLSQMSLISLIDQTPLSEDCLFHPCILLYQAGLTPPADHLAKG